MICQHLTLSPPPSHNPLPYRHHRHHHILLPTSTSTECQPVLFCPFPFLVGVSPPPYHHTIPSPTLTIAITTHPPPYQHQHRMSACSFLPLPLSRGYVCPSKLDCSSRIHKAVHSYENRLDGPVITSSTSSSGDRASLSAISSSRVTPVRSSKKWCCSGYPAGRLTL